MKFMEQVHERYKLAIFFWLYSSGNKKLQAMEKTSCASKQEKRLQDCRWEETPRSLLMYPMTLKGISSLGVEGGGFGRGERLTNHARDER